MASVRAEERASTKSCTSSSAAAQPSLWTTRPSTRRRERASLLFRTKSARRTQVEPGTAVLAIGAPVGEAYRVAPWEYGSRAARAAEPGDVDELERVADEGVAAYGEHVTMLYARACVSAQRGRHDEAVEYLRRATEDPDFGDWVREQAAQEPLLEPIRNDASFPR